jgi:hypothetical protein
VRSLHLLTAVAVAAAMLAIAPAATAGGSPEGGSCSPDASLLGFSDALDKTTFGGTAVNGLSALALDGRKDALALVDNLQTTPARFYDLRIDTHHELDVAVDKVTTLTRPDGTPYNGADFDGEGMLLERGRKTILVSSETEPSIRRFDRASGKQLASFPVPPRFLVAPAGEAQVNGTFESLSVTPDGRTLYAGMEIPLPAEGRDSEGRALNRILRYQGKPGGTYVPVSQYAYRTDSRTGLVELVALGDDQLLALERGFTAGVGNLVRVYRVTATGAPDVTNVANLKDVTDPRVFLDKELLLDVVTCPPSGATAKQPQPNPLLDNIEAMALGAKLHGDRRELYLMSDDNANPTQITRLLRFSVRIPDPFS